MYYRKTLFKCFSKYILIQNSTFQENVITKVYALEDSLGAEFKYNFLPNPKQAYLVESSINTKLWVDSGFDS